MSTPEQRKRYVVGAWKIPYVQRDVAHTVITQKNPRGYRGILGADTPDDDDKFPVGTKTIYRVELTEAEAERFAAASNARYVEEDRFYPLPRALEYPPGLAQLPSLSVLDFNRARYVDLNQWHGRDVNIAVLDTGTSPAMRAALGLTLVARTVFENNGDPSPEGDHHGCGAASCAVPPGGRLLDGVISVSGGGGSLGSTHVEAIIWAVDNGAKVVSLGAANPNVAVPSDTSQEIKDAVEYARDNDVHCVFANGNGNNYGMADPAILSRTYSNVHSSAAFDMATDRRALFSNYHEDVSGCGPGVDVPMIGVEGQSEMFGGTSASMPCMAQLLARAATGGRFTMNQVGAAFKANTRDTGATAREQGRGAYDLHLALAALGAMQRTPTIAGPHISTVVDTHGAAGFSTSMNVTLAPAVTPGDMQLVFLASSLELDTLAGTAGWQVICDATWPAGWESNAGQSIGESRVRVLARTYVEGDPTLMNWTFNGEAHDVAFGVMTLRGALGIDPKDFVPIARFGDSGSISTVSVQPNTTNDLQLCMFAQRQGTTASSASLSVPTGLTDRALIRPTSTPSGFGYPLRLATRQLTSGARTPTYTSTSNDSTGTWVSVALTVPSSFVEPAPPPPPPQQELPQGATAGAVAFLPCA